MENKKQMMENKINELRKEAGKLYEDLNKAFAANDIKLYDEIGDVMSAKYEESRKLIVEFNATFGEPPHLNW